MTTFDENWDDAYLADDDEPGDPFDLDAGRAQQPGTVLDTDADVHEHLLAMVGPDRDGPRAVWVQLLDGADRTLPIVIPVTDLPTVVDDLVVTNLARVLHAMVDANAPGGSVAVALVRRAGGDRGTFEVGWSRALRRELAAVGLPVRAIVAIGRDRSRVLPPAGTS
jgi:hypothetical protein